MKIDIFAASILVDELELFDEGIDFKKISQQQIIDLVEKILDTDKAIKIKASLLITRLRQRNIGFVKFTDDEIKQQIAALNNLLKTSQAEAKLVDKTDIKTAKKEIVYKLRGRWEVLKKTPRFGCGCRWIDFSRCVDKKIEDSRNSLVWNPSPEKFKNWLLSTLRTEQFWIKSIKSMLVDLDKQDQLYKKAITEIINELIAKFDKDAKKLTEISKEIMAKNKSQLAGWDKKKLIKDNQQSLQTNRRNKTEVAKRLKEIDKLKNFLVFCHPTLEDWEDPQDRGGRLKLLEEFEETLFKNLKLKRPDSDYHKGEPRFNFYYHCIQVLVWESLCAKTILKYKPKTKEEISEFVAEKTGMIKWWSGFWDFCEKQKKQSVKNDR